MSFYAHTSVVRMAIFIAQEDVGVQEIRRGGNFKRGEHTALSAATDPW